VLFVAALMGVAVAVVAGILALPASGRGSVAVVTTALCPLLIVVGVLLHRPRRVVPWVLLAVGCGVQATATAILLTRADDGGPVGPGLSEAISVLAYPALFAAVLGITARDASGWWVTGRTAIGSVLVGAGVLALAITFPYVFRNDLPLAEPDWAGVLGLCDVVLALVAARRVIGARPRNWSWWLIVAGFVLWGNAHAEVGAKIHEGVFDTGSALVLLLGAGPLLVGSAALVPTMVDVPRPAGADRDGRIVEWAWLVVVPSAVLAIVGTAQIERARLWLVIPLVAVLAISAVRTAGRVAELEQQTRFPS
jgi:two-component system cell cycle response regulator